MKGVRTSRMFWRSCDVRLPIEADDVRGEQIKTLGAISGDQADSDTSGGIAFLGCIDATLPTSGFGIRENMPLFR